ncbi:hypothetical protein SARC_11498, partial [Sphaeroforma arctica JP610]
MAGSTQASAGIGDAFMLAVSLKHRLANEQRFSSSNLSNPNSAGRLALPETAAQVLRSENDFNDAEVALHMYTGITNTRSFQHTAERVSEGLLQGRVTVVYEQDEMDENGDHEAGFGLVRVRSTSNIDNLSEVDDLLKDNSFAFASPHSLAPVAQPKRLRKGSKGKHHSANDLSGDSNGANNRSGRSSGRQRGNSGEPNTANQDQDGWTTPKKLPAKKRGSLVLNNKYNGRRQAHAQQKRQTITINGSFEDVNIARIELLSAAMTQTMNRRKSYYYPPGSLKNTMGRVQIFVDHSNLFFGAQMVRSNVDDQGGYVAERRLRLCVKQLVRLIEKGRQ